MPNTPNEKKMPSTAPSAAPEDAPRMSGETSGLRNRPWKAAPAEASAEPTSTAAATRGPLICHTTASTAGGRPDGLPVTLAQSTRPRRFNFSTRAFRIIGHLRFGGAYAAPHAQRGVNAKTLRHVWTPLEEQEKSSGAVWHVVGC